MNTEQTNIHDQAEELWLEWRTAVIHAKRDQSSAPLRLAESAALADLIAFITEHGLENSSNDPRRN